MELGFIEIRAREINRLGVVSIAPPVPAIDAFLQFLQVRDGTGIVQAVAFKREVALNDSNRRKLGANILEIRIAKARPFPGISSNY